MNDKFDGAIVPADGRDRPAFDLMRAVRRSSDREILRIDPVQARTQLSDIDFSEFRDIFEEAQNAYGEVSDPKILERRAARHAIYQNVDRAIEASGIAEQIRSTLLSGIREELRTKTSDLVTLVSDTDGLNERLDRIASQISIGRRTRMNALNEMQYDPTRTDHIERAMPFNVPPNQAETFHQFENREFEPIRVRQERKTEPSSPNEGPTDPRTVGSPTEANPSGDLRSRAEQLEIARELLRDALPKRAKIYSITDEEFKQIVELHKTYISAELYAREGERLLSLENDTVREQYGYDPGVVTRLFKPAELFEDPAAPILAPAIANQLMKGYVQINMRGVYGYRHRADNEGITTLQLTHLDPVAIDGKKRISGRKEDLGPLEGVIVKDIYRSADGAYYVGYKVKVHQAFTEDQSTLWSAGNSTTLTIRGTLQSPRWLQTKTVSPSDFTFIRPATPNEIQLAEAYRDVQLNGGVDPINGRRGDKIATVSDDGLIFTPVADQ